MHGVSLLMFGRSLLGVGLDYFVDTVSIGTRTSRMAFVLCCLAVAWPFAVDQSWLDDAAEVQGSFLDNFEKSE